jgi:hypothetical protein
MKKKRMWHLIDYQRWVIQNLRKVIEVNDSHLAIQDKAIIRKDEEFLVATTTVNELKLQLEDTLEALSRSRSFVRIIQSDKRRSITAMAKDLFCEFDTINMCEWEILTEKEQEEWMTYLVEIMSWEKIS